MSPSPDPVGPTGPGASRRSLLKFTGAAGVAAVLGGLRPFEAQAQVARPAALSLVPDASATRLWYPTPAAESAIITQGLPVGNGRIGGLLGGDPARECLYLTDSTLWTGGLNASLDGGGQFPYDATSFGTFTMLAKVYVAVPAHTTSAVSGYQRALDLSNGFVTTTYTYQGVTYRREMYASYPDDVVVIRLTQGGGGAYTGSVTLNGTHGETTTADATAKTASFAAALGNGLQYAAAVTATGTGGTVATSGATVTFTNCTEVVIIVSGGTNYTPDASKAFKNPAVDPRTVAVSKATAARGIAGTTLLATHTGDYQALYNTSTVNLGTSSAAQKSQDTWARLQARAASGAPADPELEASYLQFGRYLAITSSRGSVPINLQGLWLSDNAPPWMGDYHTDINLQMNYWLADRAGLGPTFTALADYCVSQVSSWTTQTRNLFNDSRNHYRNSNGKIAGWTTAISTNIYGGMGWDWHPAGNAWLCMNLWEHYQYTGDAAYLNKIYPLLKGAVQFWEARLITTTVNGATVLIDDTDWSPEHGPYVKGITYAQELVWALFDSYRKAAAALGVDAGYAQTVTGLQNQLYLPVVSPTTGWLEEWMSPDNLGETQHRHLSPLVGLFPGDRITADGSPAALLTGVRNLLTARGEGGYGWATAWRSACWARLKDSAKAYQMLLVNLKPSINGSPGTSQNFFDIYGGGSNPIFQIDANFGTPTAMVEMLLYSRAGLIELLPALPTAWAAAGSATGLGARGGFTVDLTWLNGKVTTATIHSTTGSTTTVKFGTWSQAVNLQPGGFVTVTPAPTGGRIPQSQMSVRYVDSQETTNENAPGTNVLDGSPATFWHTKWSNPVAQMPHEIQIDLGASYSVTNLYYLPRQSQANGRIANYEVYVSTDGTTWGTAVKTGTFANNTTEQTVTFTAKTGRYVRLRALSEVNGNPWTSVAELNIGTA
ncbi:hypothetical protein Lfu02_62050 [Longispora fulva]|uniref:Alpha-L-fucosidase 2 n=1 Tax=Longispora fulva TaxID=619741 RepID=A0A8J7GPR6_9ACTN|nr:glycoside hydrolase N-terminal domain-containing protein [Longispora fulva]MBG6134626.1 alpha-L-fucosidase 2 [Longispora fulva]GIG61833.1 hypothetical protein Lfu02_62050 [Longispora fulva]